jgi:hypothetical protein
LFNDLRGHEAMCILTYLWGNPVLLTAVVGTIFLLYWWVRYGRSFRGFQATCIGIAIILAIGFFWDKLPALGDLARALSTTLLPLALVFLLLTLIVTMLAALLSRRRAAIGRALRPFENRLPRSRELRLGDQKCRYCHQRGFLYRYEVQSGRHLEIQVMCSDCAAQRDATLSSI